MQPPWTSENQVIVGEIPERRQRREGGWNISLPTGVDEPTVGLDPEERVRFRNLLSDLGGEHIVLLSTHIVSDVEATATDIAVVDRGRLLAHAEPEELLRGVEGRVCPRPRGRQPADLLD